MQNWFIVIDRKIFSSEICNKPSDWFKIWIYLLSSVQYEKYKQLDRWQWYFNYDGISRELNISYNIIPKFISRAEKKQMLARQKTSRWVVITIINYDVYQSESKTEARQKQDRSKTEARLLKEQDKQDKQDKIISSNKDIIYSDDYEEFYSAFPIHKWKKEWFTAWIGAIKKANPSDIIKWAKLYAKEIAKTWAYAKRPQWWLNNNRWEDIMEDIEPEIEHKNHYEWYKRNIIWNEFTDLDWTKLKYKDINYRRFLIYERWIERMKAQELYEKAKWERFDLSI